MAKSNHYYIRKTHRWLGLLLGIQFMLWTIGGLYFSWSNIDDVHGDFQTKAPPLFSSGIALVSPSIVLDSIRQYQRIDSIVSIQLIEIIGIPYYQVRGVNASFTGRSQGHGMHVINYLANASTGILREPLTKDEAVQLAGSRFNEEPKIISVEYLTKTGNHHEYRESPLPAYAVNFSHPTKTTVYVASELGTV